MDLLNDAYTYIIDRIEIFGDGNLSCPGPSITSVSFYENPG